MLEPLRGIDVYLLDQWLKGRLSPGMLVLDAGCGGGRNIRWLLRQGFEVRAFDQDPGAVALLQADFPELADRFSVATLEAFASPQRYDFVICNAVLHFARGQAHFEAMFERLAAHLAPGGLLFVRMTTSMGMEGRLPAGQDGVYLLPDGSTRYLLHREQVELLLAANGLRLVEPVKSVLVEGLRSMATLVVQRS